ncbi:MAG: hypothetical protein H7196_00565 [candidate division SR1 bacterium]|nr:hypothetical protein [candidate division SR1 bacterium]
MFARLNCIIKNKYIRFIAVIALVLGLIFVIWSLIPINPIQKDLDEILDDKSFVVEDKNEYIVLKNKNNTRKVGLIFYPGAKVDSRAYLYKLSSLARQYNLAIYIAKPALHYAFTDINGAKKIVDDNSDIKSWAIGGHSLGGAMACTYIKNQNTIKYLVLVGAYCIDDISKTDKKVLSIKGSEDGLVTDMKIDKYKINLPSNAQFETIEGMNHAQAGNYGDQIGDNLAKSSDTFTRLRLVGIINNFLK